MTLAVFLKFLHVLTAFWLVTGLVGRNATIGKVSRTRDMHEVLSLMPLVDLFDRRMVIPASTAVLVAGLVTAWAQGWPVLGFLTGGSSNWLLVSLLLYLTTIPLVIFIFLPKGKVFDAALERATAQQQVTPELSAAFHDSTVRFARTYEMVVIFLIIALMVLKPF